MATTSSILQLINLALGESSAGGFPDWGAVADENFRRLEVALGEVTSKALASSDVTLTGEEELSVLIKLTGALGADVAVRTNDRKGFWLVDNACTGDYSVTFKTLSGTGFVIPNGSRAIAVSDGTNMLRIALLPANGAGARIKHATKAAGSYTAALADDGALHEVTATATISLKPAALLGDQWSLLVKANGAVATIDPNASELINGATTLALADGFSALILCTGTAFRAIVFGNGDVTLTATQTLTNKTFTSPTINNPTVTGLDASESAKGVVELATAPEIAAASDTTRAATPGRIKESMAYFGITYAATIPVNHQDGVNQKVTLTGSGAFGAPSNGVPGYPLNIWVVQGGAGNFAPSWNAAFDFGDYGTPGGSTGAGQADLYTFLCLTASKFVFLGIRKRVD